MIKLTENEIAAFSDSLNNSILNAKPNQTQERLIHNRNPAKDGSQKDNFSV